MCFGCYLEVFGGAELVPSNSRPVGKTAYNQVSITYSPLGIGKHRLVFITGIVAWHVYTNEKNLALAIDAASR